MTEAATASAIARLSDPESKYRAEFARDRSVAELFVLSFPKCGRTWHRAMVGTYLARLCGESAKNAFQLERLCVATQVKRIVYSHNGANFLDLLPPSNEVVASSSLWEGRPVLLLVRNPKDVLVSAYHHAHFRKPIFPGSLSEFIGDSRVGIEKIMTAYRRWHSRCRLAASFDVTSYEAMCRDPASVLRQTLALAGVTKFEQALVAEAVERCSFANMRSYEENDFFDSERMRRKSQDPRARKVREGRVGAFKNYLSAADEVFIDELIKSGGGDPFVDQYAK